MSNPPLPGSIERWAWDYLHTPSLSYKLRPPAPPQVWESPPASRRVPAPSRPAPLRVAAKAGKAPRKGALAHAGRRAELVHTFLHHELQAAELLCWALLAFATSPRAFRKGLLAICLEEIEHLQLYHAYLQRAGVAFGDHPIRDWFWQRVPRCRTPVEFVAVMGLGLEAGNLDHAQRYEEWFVEAGDGEAAALLARVRREEIGHVRFAAHWFAQFTGGVDFEAWRAALPAPLSPRLMRGNRLNRADRGRAGMSDAFLEMLSQW